MSGTESLPEDQSGAPGTMEDALRNVAHEFNNLLTTATGHADFLKRGLAASHPLQIHVDGILSSLSRATALARKLHAFGRPDSPSGAPGPAPSDRQAEASARPEPDTSMTAVSGSGETILLVEDDEDVRFLLQSILKSDGYTVLEAWNGERALELAAAHAGSIHLILTDLHMPGMDGRRVAETLLSRHPGMKAMFMSGFPEEDFQREDWEIPVSFLQKPFMPKSMLRQVRKVFDG